MNRPPIFRGALKHPTRHSGILHEEHLYEVFFPHTLHLRRGRRLRPGVPENGSSRLLLFVNLTSGFSQQVTLNVGPEPMSVALSEDGSLAFVTNYGGDSLTVIDTATRR